MKPGAVMNLPISASDTTADKLWNAIEQAVRADYRNLSMTKRRELQDETLLAVRRFFDDRIAGR